MSSQQIHIRTDDIDTTEQIERRNAFVEGFGQATPAQLDPMVAAVEAQDVQALGYMVLIHASQYALDGLETELDDVEHDVYLSVCDSIAKLYAPGSVVSAADELNLYEQAAYVGVLQPCERRIIIRVLEAWLKHRSILCTGSMRYTGRPSCLPQ